MDTKFALTGWLKLLREKLKEAEDIIVYDGVEREQKKLYFYKQAEEPEREPLKADDFKDFTDEEMMQFVEAIPEREVISTLDRMRLALGGASESDFDVEIIEGAVIALKPVLEVIEEMERLVRSE